MRGYVLTVQASEQQALLAEIQLLDAVIAKKQAREYLKESHDVKQLIAKESPNYLPVQATYTAQRDNVLLTPNF